MFSFDFEGESKGHVETPLEQFCPSASTSTSTTTTTTTQLALSGTPGVALWKSCQSSDSDGDGLPPTARWGHSATTVGPETMLVFGGYGEDKFTDHLYSYKPAQSEWERVKTTGHGPSPRSNHSATAVGENLLVVHGGGKKGTFDTYHAYDSEQQHWKDVKVFMGSHHKDGVDSTDRNSRRNYNRRKLQQSSQLPAQRSAHAACRVGGKYVVVFGGKIGKEDTAASFLLDVSSMLPSASPNPHDVPSFDLPLWEGNLPSIMSPKPVARRFHTLCTHWQSGAGILFGGCYGEYQCLGDVWVVKCVSKDTQGTQHTHDTPDTSNTGGSLVRKDQPVMSWTKLKPQGTPPTKRWGHSASIVSDHLIIIGGRAQTDLMDIHLLTLASLSNHELVRRSSNRWSTPDLSASPHSPLPRRRATACTYAGHGATLTNSSNANNRTRILVFGGYDGHFRNDLLSLNISGLTVVESELPVATEIFPVRANGTNHSTNSSKGTTTTNVTLNHPLAHAEPQTTPPTLPASVPSAPLHSSFQQGMSPLVPSIPAAPSAPVPSWDAMFVPPPPDLYSVLAPPSSTMSNSISNTNELVFGETKASVPSSTATMKIQTKDQELILPIKDVELLRRLLPVFFMMKGEDVQNCLPRLKEYDAKRPPLVPSSGRQPPKLAAKNSTNTRHEGGRPSTEHSLGIRAAKMCWMDDDDVTSVMQMGYSRSRVFRAIHATRQTVEKLNLNVLLDACEKEPEQSLEDESIAASYMHAISGGGSGSDGYSNSSHSGSFVFGGRSMVNKKGNRKKLKVKSSRKNVHGGGGGGGTGNASQRVMELEAQVKEMKDDLATLLQCSITFDLMEDPVVTPNGQLYDRCNIEAWINKKHTDPSTRHSLRKSQLVKVRDLKDIADKYRGRGLFL